VITFTNQLRTVDPVKITATLLEGGMNDMDDWYAIFCILYAIFLLIIVLIAGLVCTYYCVYMTMRTFAVWENIIEQWENR